jgi:hypothetical protein
MDCPANYKTNLGLNLQKRAGLPRSPASPAQAFHAIVPPKGWRGEYFFPYSRQFFLNPRLGQPGNLF